MFSILSVGWGLLSDIDIESERLRVIGGQRFTIWSLARLIGLRTYRGKVFYLPVSAPPVSPYKNTAVIPHSLSQDAILDDCEDCLRTDGDCENCRTNGIICLDTTAEDVVSKESRQRLDSWYSATSRRSAYFSTAGSDYLSVSESYGQNGKTEPARVYGPASRLPALTAPAPASWKKMEGEFIMVHAGYQTHLGEDVVFAPDSRLDDGIIWLLVVRGNATRAQLLAFLLGLNTGAHAVADREDANIRLIPVSAFRIEPQPDPSHPAHLTVDGELVCYGPVQGEICSLQNKLFVPSN